MRRSVLVLWALLAAAFCWRLDPVTRPLMGDNQLYFYMAERAASGVPPHVSHVDSKNQLGVLLTAAAIGAGRGFGVDDVLASRVASVALTALSVALAAELAALLAGTGASSALAGHVGALALIATRGLAEHSAAGNNVKTFLVTFVLLAHVAMARAASRGTRDRSSPILAGLAAGAAFLCWQPALIVVAAVVLEALLARGGSARRALVVAAAALVPLVLYELYFAAHGALGEQLYQAYVMASASVHHPRSLSRAAAFVATEGSGALRLVPLGFAMLAAGSLAGVVLAPRRALAALRERAGVLSFVAAAAGVTAFTFYDHQGVPDLFFADPYFAVATGLLVSATADLARRFAARPAAAAVAIVAVAALLWQIRGDDARRRPPGYGIEDQRRLAEVVHSYHEQFAGVWVYGAVHLLGLSHLDNHVPYGLFYDDVLSVISLDRYLPLRDGRMPQIIVHSRGQLPGARRYLDSDYVEITPPDFAVQSAMVWRRVDAQQAGIAVPDSRESAAQPAPAPVRAPRRQKAGRSRTRTGSGGIVGPAANRR